MDAARYPAADALRQLLDQDHRLTKADAARRLGRHPRSITRLVRDLRRAGVPVRDEPDPADGRRKRFFLDPEHQRRGLRLHGLDETQILALVVAAEAARSALRHTPLAAPLDDAFEALLDAAGHADGLFSFEPEHEPDRWHFGAPAQLPDPRTFSALRRLASAERRARIDYTRADGTRSDGREVSPLGFGRVRSGWVLVAFCHLRDAVRDFSLPAVSHVAPLTAPAHVPDGFSIRRHFAQRFGALQGDAPVEVQLRVSPERAVYFHRRRYHPSQSLTEHADGSLTAAYRVPGGDALDEVRAFVASWGPHVVALAPPALAGRLADDAQRTAQAYAALDPAHSGGLDAFAAAN